MPPFFPLYGSIKMVFIFTPGQQGADSKGLLTRECYAALKEKGRTKPRCPFLVSGGGQLEQALGWDRPQSCCHNTPEGRQATHLTPAQVNLRAYFWVPHSKESKHWGGCLPSKGSVPSRPPSLWPLEPTHQDRLSNPLPGLGCPRGTSGHPSTPE